MLAMQHQGGGTQQEAGGSIEAKGAAAPADAGANGAAAPADASQ